MNLRRLPVALRSQAAQQKRENKRGEEKRGEEDLKPCYADNRARSERAWRRIVRQRDCSRTGASNL